MVIKRNRAQCTHCGDIIESKRKHDWVACQCWDTFPDNSHGIFVDGGVSYLRRGYANESEFKDLSEYEDTDKNE